MQASELLNHPHLQPFIQKIHVKLNNPRRHTYPMQWSSSPNYMKNIRCMGSEGVPISGGREKRWSFSNDRMLYLRASRMGLGSPCSSQRAQDFGNISEDFEELSVGDTSQECSSDRQRARMLSRVAKTPRLSPSSAAVTPRRRSTVPKKVSHATAKRDSVSF